MYRHQSRCYGSEGYEAGQKCVERQSGSNNNIFSLIKRLTNALRCTFTCYAIEILTTNRTDSLQYNGANSSLQSMSTLRGSNSVPVGLCARCYPMRYRPPPPDTENYRTLLRPASVLATILN